MEKIMRGTIFGLHGMWGSGLATLCFEDGTSVPCDNGTTVRAMDACFGGVIGEAHTINQDALIGKEIYWSYDEFGLVLGGFTPVDEASEELLEMVATQDA